MSKEDGGPAFPRTGAAWPDREGTSRGVEDGYGYMIDPQDGMSLRDWSAVHRAPPGPDRWKVRSRTFDGIATAIADQWGLAVFGDPNERQRA